MKRFLLFVLSVVVLNTALIAQTTILDFEDAATSTTFTYFGSTANDSSTVIIPNPDMSGINTSATVSDFYKPSGSEVWAGAFSNPNPSVPIDLVSNSEICVKVWFPAPGNLALKIENGDLPNWIRTEEVAVANEWVELCYDTRMPSIEDDMVPAFGGTYSTMVLFFDFGTSLTDDQVYFFDDVELRGSGIAPVDLTFNVDLTGQTFTEAFVSGTFNGWSLDNPLSDDDGDGVYSATVTGVPAGGIEYKFQLDNTVWEEFSGTETCVIRDPSGDFVNRSFVATQSEELPTVCFNSCFACGDAVRITFNVGQGGATIAPEGMHIAGGGNFGVPGDFPMSDDDGDGVWTITFERPVGFESFYTFLTGACPDWSCKEDVSGQACANPDNFNDRLLGPVMADMEINTCYGFCTDDLDCSGATGGDVTFNVDMNGYSGSFNTVFLSGNFNSWSGDANPMEDPDGDNIWTTTVNFITGNHQYKFQVDSWTDQEFFMDGDPCTATEGNFVNRVVEVSGDTEVCFGWQTCTSCLSGVNDLVVDNSIFKVQPTIVESSTQLVFGENFNEEKIVSVFNGLGQIEKEIKLAAWDLNYTLDASNLQNGLYFVNVVTKGKPQTQRIIINK